LSNGDLFSFANAELMDSSRYAKMIGGNET